MNITVEVLKDIHKMRMVESLEDIEKCVVIANRLWNNFIVYALPNDFYKEDIINTLVNGGYKVTRGKGSMPHLIKIEWESNRTINPF